MVIVIGSETICDGPTRDVNKSSGPSAARIVAPNAVQLAEYLRAAFILPIDRGLKKVEFSFEVRRLCADVAAAETFFLLHPITVTRSGTVVITPTGGNGIRILNAVLDGCTLDHIGATVHVAYHITGQKAEVVA